MVTIAMGRTHLSAVNHVLVDDTCVCVCVWANVGCPTPGRQSQAVKLLRASIIILLCISHSIFYSRFIQYELYAYITCREGHLRQRKKQFPILLSLILIPNDNQCEFIHNNLFLHVQKMLMIINYIFLKIAKSTKKWLVRAKFAKLPFERGGRLERLIAVNAYVLTCQPVTKAYVKKYVNF